MLKGGKKQVRLDSGVGIKPISITGTKRLVRMAIQHALENGRKSVTLVHKGNIQKFTEGAFRKWGYELATEEFRDKVVTERESWIIDNKDKNPNLTVEHNANLVEPGLEFAPEEFRQSVYAEVKDVLSKIYSTHDVENPLPALLFRLNQAQSTKVEEIAMYKVNLFARHAATLDI